ncbi:hypothetical protein C3007_09175 [Avibacterium gallinarum]|nr:hypothetical protein C3007_09175 [Avibacterium gallinarum]
MSKNKIFYLSTIKIFCLMYCIIFSKYIFFMAYIYIKDNVLFFKNTFFYEALIITLSIYIPYLIIYWVLYKYESEKYNK